MANNDAWWIGTDNKVTLKGLQRDDESYLNNADLVGELQDTVGNVVANGTGITFTYIVNSGGEYEALLPKEATTGLTAKQTYYLFIYVVEDPDGIPDNDDDREALLRMARKAQYIDI